MLKDKLDIFKEVVLDLNHKIELVPVLFGSLGLYKLLEVEKDVHDIDLLVPQRFIVDEWDSLHDVMTGLSFEFFDEKEYAFKRDKTLVSFGHEEYFGWLTGDDPRSLQVDEYKGAKFRELSLAEFLEAYEMLYGDEERRRRKGEQDLKKIELIRERLGA